MKYLGFVQKKPFDESINRSLQYIGTLCITNMLYDIHILKKRVKYLNRCGKQDPNSSWFKIAVRDRTPDELEEANVNATAWPKRFLELKKPEETRKKTEVHKQYGSVTITSASYSD